MLRKRYLVSALSLALVALSLGVWQSVASASSTVSFNVSERGDYSCVGPCATASSFTTDGIAHSVVQSFGTMKFSAAGTVLGVNAEGCLVQAEAWAFTTQNGHEGKDTIFMSTTSDLFCPTANPNAFVETATFTITGGTGRFSGATGVGTFMLTVLGHPQTASGTLSATIAY